MKDFREKFEKRRKITAIIMIAIVVLLVMIIIYCVATGQELTPAYYNHCRCNCFECDYRWR